MRHYEAEVIHRREFSNENAQGRSKDCATVKRLAKRGAKWLIVKWAPRAWLSLQSNKGCEVHRNGTDSAYPCAETGRTS